jgi:hypothetical protein
MSYKTPKDVYAKMREIKSFDHENEDKVCSLLEDLEPFRRNEGLAILLKKGLSFKDRASRKVVVVMLSSFIPGRREPMFNKMVENGLTFDIDRKDDKEISDLMMEGFDDEPLPRTMMESFLHAGVSTLGMNRLVVRNGSVMNKPEF